MLRIPSSGGVAVAVHRLGGVAGRPRVLVSHATGFHAHCYVPIARALGDRFECFGLDHRGHGATAAPDDWEVAWPPFGADALAVASHLAPPDGLIGIGHSMGGAALLMAAARRPRLFQQLLLFEPIAFPASAAVVDMDEHPIVVGARRRRRRFDSRDDAIANFATKPPMSLMTTEALRLYVEHGFVDADDGGIELRCSPEVEAAIFVTARRNGVWDLLPGIEVPTLVVTGEIDERQPSGRASDIAARLPHGTYLELPHLTHFGPFSHPGDIAGLA